MKETIADIIKLHKKLVDDFEKKSTKSVVAIASMIVKCTKNQGCVYICGNGGSAADAQHIAGELVGRFLRERKAISAVALTTDTSILTSIGNDYGFDHIFSRQVEGLIKQKDLLWAFSTSGTSPNIIAAAKMAKEKGASVIAFTGKTNTPLEDIADLSLSIETPNSFHAQQIHQLAYHMICKLIEDELCE